MACVVRGVVQEPDRVAEEVALRRFTGATTAEEMESARCRPRPCILRPKENNVSPNVTNGTTRDMVVVRVQVAVR